MDINSKLTHTADLYYRSGTSDSGEIIYTLRKNISCLTYGSKSRVTSDSQPQTSTRTTDYAIIVKVDQTIELGDQLRSGKDINGFSLFDKVEVISIKPIVHKDRGLISKELGVVNLRG